MCSSFLRMDQIVDLATHDVSFDLFHGFVLIFRVNYAQASQAVTALWAPYEN